LYKIPARSLFMGKNVVFVPECHSTNALAHELSQNTSIIDGTILITNHQTAGRGQRGNTWDSEPGKNLTFSLVIKPYFLAITDQFFLNIFTSLAIHDVLRDKISATVNIKWPNDILVNRKKLCGILIENQIHGQQVSNSIVGIGLNVNQAHFTLPAATSLLKETGLLSDLPDLFEDIVGSLESRYLQLRAGHLAALKEQYLERLYWKDEKHLFTSNDGPFEGSITGIDEIGKLKIKVADEERSFRTSELKYVE
jgi:BirA family transcriptional regulator, biotin operon repressor / biotin---[acetyl-CoA-carboxylase] ligase